MKKCPACQSTYTDETLVYCLQDGVPLEESDAGAGEHETVVRRTVPEAVTVSIPVDAGTEEVTSAAIRSETSDSSGGSKTLVTILVTIVAMLLLFGVIGIAAVFYFGGGRSADTTVANPNTNSGNAESSLTPDATVEATPEPTATEEVGNKPPTPTPTDARTPTPKPTSTPDAGDIKRQVSGRVYSWKSLAESRSLGPYMNYYGSKIDYYRKSGASRSFVRNDKQKAFSKYSTIRIKISGMKVTPSRDGKTAQAVFDKEWLFANSQTKQTGKVRSRLVFRKVGGDWRIVSERDLKVYYVNK